MKGIIKKTSMRIELFYSLRLKIEHVNFQFLIHLD